MKYFLYIFSDDAVLSYVTLSIRVYVITFAKRVKKSYSNNIGSKNKYSKIYNLKHIWKLNKHN